MSVINRLKIRALEPDETEELTEFERLRLMAAFHEEVIRKEAMKQGLQEGLQEGIEKGIEKVKY